MANSFIYLGFDLSEDVSSITHTVSSGTVTSLTDKELMFERSPSDAYYFQTSTVSQSHTIDITYTSNKTIFPVAMFGLSSGISSIRYQLLNSFSSVIYDSGLGSYDSQRYRKLQGSQVYDYHWYPTSATTFVRKIRITFTTSTANTYRFGLLFAGSTTPLSFGIKPKSLDINGDSKGNKTETDGGQIIANTHTNVQVVQFTTTSVPESELILTFLLLNQENTVATPFVFIPYLHSKLFIYCNQVRPSSQRTIEAPPDSNNEMYFETSCQFKEEL